MRRGVPAFDANATVNHSAVDRRATLGVDVGAAFAAFFLDDGGNHGVIACDTRQAAQHAGEALKAAVLTGERRCVIDCRVDTFDSCSRRFAADDTARWIRRCANEVAFFFETCTLLYPQAASGAAPTAAGLPVEPLLRKWGRVMDGSEDHGLAPTDCFFVASPSNRSASP